MTQAGKQETESTGFSLTDGDHRAIAKYLAAEMRSPFDIEPKEHYDNHKVLAEMTRSFVGFRSIFTKILLGLLAAGSIALMLQGFVGKKLGLG